MLGIRQRWANRAPRPVYKTPDVVNLKVTVYGATMIGPLRFAECATAVSVRLLIDAVKLVRPSLVDTADT